MSTLCNIIDYKYYRNENFTTSAHPVKSARTKMCLSEQSIIFIINGNMYTMY